MTIYSHPTKLLAIATVAAAFSQLAFAQSESSPSRAEVKAQTRAAQKAHELTPAGEGPIAEKPSRTRSTKTRAERKGETLQARNDGNLPRTGPAADLKVERAAYAVPSKKTRAERKTETLSAAKAGKLIPAGEAGAPRN